MYKISLEKLPVLLAAIAKEGKLYVPARKGSTTDFALWSAETDVDIEKHLTARSAKDLFFPQVENLYSFKTEGKKISIEEIMPTDEMTIAFGVRACDIRSFEILDMVFLKDPVDPYYKKRRENTVLIGLGCAAPEETCFCGTFGIDAAAPAGDVTTYAADGFLYWEPRTDKGSALTETVKALFETADDLAPVEAQRNRTRDVLKKLPLGSFRIAPKITESELKTFDSDVWNKLYQGCLACCTCTFVCPTCHCYDIRDFVPGETRTDRYRCWDSCMNRDFTKMAAENPRKTQKERFRQRFMHKLVYFPENNDGVYSCVGCGRCLAKCPVCNNIVKVAKALEASEDV
ncbi:MAG: 4Fe-4S dicluster domain-containing protein [Pyramidobacter sp.]|nr:4Fe-4S dicluster domain-containing protein [Pyramidobacter sp.]